MHRTFFLLAGVSLFIAGTSACSDAEGGAGSSTGGSVGSGGSSGGTGGTTSSTGGGGGSSTGGSTGETGGTAGSGGSGGSTDDAGSGSDDGGTPGTGGSGGGSTGPLTITVESDPGPNGTYCFKEPACNDGGNHSPKVDWSGIPAGTKSLVVSMKDHDGQAHFVMCNIKPTETGLPADIGDMVLPGAEVGYGNKKHAWYGPGAGDVRDYEWRIWALTTETLEGGCTDSNAAYDDVLIPNEDKIPHAAQILRGNVSCECN
jgi:Raf kinase inhibitor-like YbhB/YbcL family protein